MKHILISFILLLGMVNDAFSLEMSITNASFKNGDKSYLELYFRVLGETVKYIDQERSSRKASIGITVIVEDLDGTIVTFDKFSLHNEAKSAVSDFINVKRFALAPDSYLLKIEANDLNDTTSNLYMERRVIVENYDLDVALSDVQIFSTVQQSLPTDPSAKNGLLFEPFIYNYVGDDQAVLHIYTEVYNKRKGLHFLKFSIVDNGNVMIEKYKKMKEIDIQPIYSVLPIDEVPSGSYDLVIELFDANKALVEVEKLSFTRSNSTYDKVYWSDFDADDDFDFVSDLSETEIDYALRAISPIVYEPRKSIFQMILTESTLNAKKKFLYDFYKEENSENPYQAYIDYMTVAKKIDVEFQNNVGHGFETDRGYIFLRYGRPNNVVDVDTEPDAPPYQIWYYDFLEETVQNNVRFLFYNPSLVTNDFQLLHSNCIGERQNPQWEVELYRDAQDSQVGNTIDATTVKDGWGRNARNLFNDY